MDRNSAWTLPLTFERNEGQLPQDVVFLGRTQRYSVAVGSRQLTFSLPGVRTPSSVVLSFEGSGAARPAGLTESTFRTNYYLGKDGSKYRTGIRNYSRIGLPHLYPGIDAEFYASGQEIEHDFLVAPGADASAIGMQLRGGSPAKLTEKGEVVVTAEEGELRLRKPVAYQAAPDGTHTEVAAEFVLDTGAQGAQGLRFRLGPYDHTRRLVIDPVIVYATFTAGTAGSTATAIATDPSNNVYVTGVTTSSAFGASPAPVSNCSATCTNNVFVAQLAGGSNGSTLQWITYIGASQSGSATVVKAIVANSAAVYIGGYTNDTALAAGAAVSAPNPTGGYVGFLSGLTPSNGTLNNTTLVYIDTASANDASVQALALDASGNVYAAGALGTTQTTTLAMSPTANAFAVAPAITTYSGAQPTAAGNAYVLEILAGGPFGVAGTGYLAQPHFFTYVQNNTQINGLALDAAGLIYLGGQTTGGFTTPLASPVANTGPAGTNDAFDLTFTPNPASAASTVTAFTWIDGSGNDTVAGLTIDGAGNSYLLGNTTSTGIGTATNSVTAAPTIQPAPADTTENGFAALIPAGGTTPTALTYLGGSGSVDTVTGGAFSAGSLYITGTTNAPATTSGPSVAFANVPSTVASSTSPFNLKALAYGMDATTAGVSHGYLASLNGALTAVNYVANLGGAASGDSASGVALDSGHNAYIAANILHGSIPYTSYGAYQGTSPSTANPSAYVAEIAYSGTTAALSLSPASSGSPSADPIGYGSPSDASSVTYTWVLTAGAATSPTDLIVQIPALAALTYTSASVVNATNTGAAANLCTVSIAGVSCVIASVPQTVAGTNDTLHIILNATVTAAAPTSGTLTVAANVADSASDYVNSNQTSHLLLPASLTITPASTFGASTVFSTNNASAGSSTLATYTFTVANAAGSGDTGTATFTLSTPPANFSVASAAAATGGGTITTCDTSTAATGCTAFDLPGGATLTYTVTGTYLDAAVGAGVASSAAAGAFTASAAGFLSHPSQTVSPHTTVERGVHLVLGNSLNALPTGQTAFNLTDPVTYSITLTNQGPSASSGHDALAVTLPSGFVATGVTGITCSAPYTACTVPVLPAGASLTYAIAGSFPDTGTNSTVTGTPVSKTFSAAATLNLSYAFESGSTPADYAATTSTSIQRTATLVVRTATLGTPATVCGGGAASCVYMQNTNDTRDKVPYSFSIQNAGPDTALNAHVTITLPFAPPNPGGTLHPLNGGTPVAVPSAPGFGATLTCNYQQPANQIVCAGGNLPVGTTVLTVSGNATLDPGAVSATAESVTTAAAPGSVVITEDATGAPPLDPLPVIEIDRAAHLVTAKTVAASGSRPASPINLDEKPATNTAGVNDTYTVAVQVGATPLNDVPAGTVVTEMLPAFFKFTTLPPGNCTVGGAPITFTAPAPGRSSPVSMSCVLGAITAGSGTPAVGSTAPVFGSGSQTFSYSGKFQDNGVNPDITGTLPAKQAQLNLPLGMASSVTTLAVDPVTPSDATSAPASVAVARVAHLVLRKTRNITVAAAPATFADRTDPNLDEKTATPFGVNDEIEYGVAVGNGGVNSALGVQFTEALPPFFTVLKTYGIAGAPTTPDSGANAAPTAQLPANAMACFAGAAATGTPLALPFATGAGGQQITCTYGIPSNPLALPPGTSGAGVLDNATSFEFVYQGKYQDNAANSRNPSDNIGLGVSTYAVVSLPGDATATAPLTVDYGPATDSKSLAVPTYSIQRAAHLAIVGTPLQLRTDDSPLTPGPAGTPPMIAEAEPSSTGSATPVYNCIRYKVLVQNSGPNAARQPVLKISLPTGLNLAGSATVITSTPAADAALAPACSYGASISPTVAGAAIAPVSQVAGNTLLLDVDGYFGLNTLHATNAQTGFAPTFASLGDPGIMESATNKPFTPLTGATVTVVNTPSNVSPDIPSAAVASRFFVSPFSAAGTQPVRLDLGTVSAPGATTLGVGATGPAMPAGPSPNPADNKKVIPLYRPGATPNFYNLGTTAAVGSANNLTAICVSNGTASGALSDGFAKPERVLLWALAGLPTGSALNPVPNTASPYTGDVTASVRPVSGASYVAPGAGGSPFQFTTYSSYPAAQSQPAEVCGQVNGFAPAAAPLTLAVLEPVNFSPDVIASGVQQTQAPGKGISEVSFVFPTVHDYNDHDPCYVSATTSGTSTRGVCDDNLLLLTWIFGAERLVPSRSHLIGPLSQTAAQAFEAGPYEVQAGATLYLQAADQLAVPLYNAAGNCDPGVSPPAAPGSYQAVGPCAAKNEVDTTKLAGTPPQETLFGSAAVAELSPSVNGGSSGIIILPPALDPTVPTTVVDPAYPMAMATLTAGQTAAFQWKLMDLTPPQGGTYTLSCFMVDASLNTLAAFPAGLSCQIQSTIVIPAAGTTAAVPPNPTIYVVTAGTSNAGVAWPGWPSALGTGIAALLLPLCFFRRRRLPGRVAGLFALLLLLGGAATLSGCGSGLGLNTTTALAPGTYSFRATASVKGGTTLTTAPFQVTVVAGN